jgi:hypothetical protein
MHHDDNAFPERGDSPAQVGNIGMRESGHCMVACLIGHGFSMNDREPWPPCCKSMATRDKNKNYIDSAKDNLSAY